MSEGPTLLKQGPIVLLSRIASAFFNGAEADIRAQITIHLRGGKAWTGVPIEIVHDIQNRPYVVLELLPKKNTVLFEINDIQAVEIENLKTMESFLEKPWLRDEKFRNVSKLQFQREMESFWNFLPSLKVIVEFDTFPKNDDFPGVLLAWMSELKKEIHTILADKVGKEALEAIEQFTFGYGSQPLTITKDKDGKKFLFSVVLTKESFDKALISKCLNENL